ncbi:MAG TPA: TraB/GumN family protein [Vitreimonas sp.]|uniref:TraB/GumN family protein n=1 Tax=Vitreimonas sp. TaxID=3069702 RepID=UPI002D4E2C04|nr:TraB/GumN family protein [Vitreimonas sp.]HYD89016.1 TraB/GumN family protein [Vitreimonas sp.]
MSIARTLLAALAVAFLAACASTPAPNDIAGAAPALFVARDADSTMYLYGTIHLRRAGDPWGGPHVEAALVQSEEIWTEVDLDPAAQARAQTEAMRHGMSPDTPLSTHLNEEDRQRLAALSQRFGIPIQALDRMHPWMAALTLSVMPMMQAGYDPQAGVDRAIVAWAGEHQKTLRSFETPEQQIGFFANWDEETQIAWLRQSLEGAEEGVALVNGISAAWDRGDTAALEAQIVTETRTTYPDLYQLFFVGRNNAWMEVLSQELDGAGVDFVAVGSGHLYGPDGLIAQLRARGVRVERVQQARE